MEKTLSLGERILLVARLAVEEHLLQSVTAQTSSQSQVTVGGADLDRVKDDSLLLARGRGGFLAAAFTAEGEAA
ncbi:MAG TPA: hypothetical protein VHS31_13395 [Tepidisphaeraceae bacterium]|nr:hypothetical protein [Tepidisphaeraceae bacterium]